MRGGAVVSDIAPPLLDRPRVSVETDAMAYDEALAARIRDHVLDLAPQALEQKMFGGLAFLVGGHLAVAASGSGGLMLRCAPEDTDRLLEEPGAGTMVMRGRAMDGWLRVDDTTLDEAALERWVRIGVDFASSLPPKR